MARQAERRGLALLARDLTRVPRLFVGTLLLLAICVMLAGVFLRYVVAPITDMLDVDPVSFFWVEEMGELLLAWLTLVGAAVGIAERTHFTVDLFTQYLPASARRAVHIGNHLVIAAFGGVIAWQGCIVASLNRGLTSPALGIDMGWLYGALVAGGVLIALFGLTAGFRPETSRCDILE